MASTQQVYPCQCPEGHHLVEPPQKLDGLSKKEAEALVATLAYSYRPDGLHEEPTSTEGPADAGPLDSTEA